MKKNFLLACNFKNNYVDFKTYQQKLEGMNNDNVIVCPNFCQVGEFLNLKTKGVKVGAQNVTHFVTGSHTGETTVEILKQLGSDVCIVGHSERRKDFHETSQEINTKLKLLIENSITPILCVGEGISDNIAQTEWAKQFVSSQLLTELADVDSTKVLVAYEPIWAIGSGKVADEKHIAEVCGHIKSICTVSAVLYGGSVNTQNFESISKIEVVDGVLIGKACLDAENINIMQRVLKQ